jgi:DNA-binding NtrC family response regulator
MRNCSLDYSIFLKKTMETVAERFNLQNRTENSLENITQRRDLSSIVDRISNHDIPLLITGEIGTGKELVAKTLHHQGSRSSYPFVYLRCSSASPLLFERELFGHENGRWPQKPETHIGKFELANKGTILLDEISEISLQTQKKLLRYLEQGEIERIGSSKSVGLDVRVITASSKNLLDAVASGKFLEELYYVLCPITIEISPLCFRKDDLASFIEFYLQKFSNQMNKRSKTLSKDAHDLLMNYEWPGNERELRNVIERAVLVAKGHIIYPEELPAYIRDNFMTLEEMEKQHIFAALKKANGNKTKAASLLDIGRATLYAKLKLFSQTPCLKE